MAVRERAVTLFLLLAVTAAGIFAFQKLGRAEDPTFTVKTMAVSAAWPGATTDEMQRQVADPLEKRLQELVYYDRVETTVRPGLMLMKVFGFPPTRGYEHAKEVDSAGRTLLITTSQEHAELKQEQVHSFGPDPFVKKCSGSMTCVIEPA